MTADSIRAALTAPDARATIAERAGLAAVFVVAFSAYLSRDVTRAAEVVAALAFLAAAGRFVRRTPGRWLFAAAVAAAAWMLLVDQVFAAFPDAAEDSDDFLKNYIKLFSFLLPAAWLAGSEARARAVLLTAAAGSVVALTVRQPAGDWLAGTVPERAVFGFHNAEHTAVVFGSVLLGLAAYAPRFLAPRETRMRRAGAVAVWLGLLAFTLLALRAAESRQAWLALMLAALAALPRVLATVRRAEIARGKRRTLAAGLVALTLGIGALNPFGSAMSRTAAEWGPVAAWLSGEAPPTPTSVTIRLQQWGFAVEAIAKRPLTGYGGGATAVLIARSGLPDYIQRRFGHVHNSYLDMALAYGLPAAGAFVLILVMLYRAVAAAHRAGHLGDSSAAFGVAWLVFFAVVNVFESYVNYHTAYYLVFVVGGALYGAASPPPGPESASAASRRRA